MRSARTAAAILSSEYGYKHMGNSYGKGNYKELVNALKYFANHPPEGVIYPERIPREKITADMQEEICRKYEEGFADRMITDKIQEMFNISLYDLLDILVKNGLYREYDPYMKDEWHFSGMEAEIILLYIRGIPEKIIAKKNGVSEARVYRVVNTFARKRTGPSWTKHDITVLLKLRHAGLSIKSISVKLHRKQPSVYAKLTKIQKYLEHVMEEESNAG